MKNYLSAGKYTSRTKLLFSAWVGVILFIAMFIESCFVRHDIVGSILHTDRSLDWIYEVSLLRGRCVITVDHIEEAIVVPLIDQWPLLYNFRVSNYELWTRYQIYTPPKVYHNSDAESFGHSAIVDIYARPEDVFAKVGSDLPLASKRITICFGYIAVVVLLLLFPLASWACHKFKGKKLQGSK